jgi:hypothetical protein
MHSTAASSEIHRWLSVSFASLALARLTTA